MLCEVGIVEQAANGALVWLGRDTEGQHLFNTPIMKDAVIEVIDASGRIVHTRTDLTIAGQVRLNAGLFSAGVYTLLIRGKKATVYARFAH